MNPVIQEDQTGCGIASVATLAGVSYQHTKQLALKLGISVTDSRLWSETAYIRKLLRRYQIRTTANEIPFSSWESLPNVALLAIKWHSIEGKPFWHWTVFWRSPNGPVVLDPKHTLRTHHRTDFGRIKPKWYIPVTQVPKSLPSVRIGPKTP